MSAKSYVASRIENVKFVLPEHLNNMGNMHGGEIMKLMDDTAGLTFIHHAGGKAVTAAANDIRFIKPIPANSIIKCVTEIVGTGRSSMQVAAKVFLRIIETEEDILVAEGMFVGVAIDEQGKPRNVPAVIINQSRMKMNHQQKDA